MCVAIPGKITKIEDNVATLDVSGTLVTARLDLIGEELQVGDYVLTHAGFAINRISTEEAEELNEIWAELGGASW